MKGAKVFERSGFKDYSRTYWINEKGVFGCRYQCKHCGKVTLGMGADSSMHYTYCPRLSIAENGDHQ